MTTLKQNSRDYRPFSIYIKEVKTFFLLKNYYSAFRNLKFRHLKKNKFSYKIIKDIIRIFVFLYSPTSKIKV
jgi:hypothetical protein